MGNLVKLIILAAVVYGIFWAIQNVNFEQVLSDTNQKIQQEKTITRVTGGRARAVDDTRKVVE